jgi:hypothetical protein
MSKGRKKTTVASVISRCHPDPSSDCWFWKGSYNGAGYAVVSIGNEMQYVHRIVYEHHHGPIPDGLVINHKCENRGCVNIGHLELETYRGNTNYSLGKRDGYCIRGHDMEKVGYTINVRGTPVCNECKKIYNERDMRPTHG